MFLVCDLGHLAGCCGSVYGGWEVLVCGRRAEYVTGCVVGQWAEKRCVLVLPPVGLLWIIHSAPVY